MKRPIIVVVFLVLVLAVGFTVWREQQKNRHSEQWYSGTIDAHQSNISFQTSGRVSRIIFDEGQSVKAGDVIAELDTDEYAARLEQAKSNLIRAEKSREQLVDVLNIYKKSLPADVKQAQAALSIAKDVTANVRKNSERYTELYKRGVVTEKERDDVRLAYDNASSRFSQAEAALAAANSNLGRIDATEKDIAQASAQVLLAKAMLNEAGIRLGYTKLLSPLNGIITSRNIELGEVVSPGREVMTVSDLTRVYLKIYVRETEIGKVRPGQPAEVKIDSMPERVFKGNVSYISQVAEFTPKIIQTKEERVKYVYLVKISIYNPDLSLKSGLPADAWLK